MSTIEKTASSLTQREIFSRWWPLALSWFFMSAELPFLTIVLARLQNPEIHLGALGGIILPLSFLIEAPVLMMLSAGAALVGDGVSYQRVRKYMLVLGLGLGLLHAIVSLTPLYDFLVLHIIGAPEELAEAARVGMILMIPFTPAVAHRRFQQGVLVRRGKTRSVTLGTALRLCAIVATLAIGMAPLAHHGAALTALAISAGVITECVFISWISRDAISDLPPPAASDSGITWKAFLVFYAPLAWTTLLFNLLQPIGSAAMTRMPLTVESLAVWPAVAGFLFMLRSIGIALNEIVISLAGHQDSEHALWIFARKISLVMGTTLVICAASFFSAYWFGNVTGLTPELSELARRSLWFALPAPFLSPIVSYYQGFLISRRMSGAVSGSVFAHLSAATAVLLLGAFFQEGPGIFAALTATSAGIIAQTVWVRRRWKLLTAPAPIAA